MRIPTRASAILLPVCSFLGALLPLRTEGPLAGERNPFDALKEGRISVGVRLGERDSFGELKAGSMFRVLAPARGTSEVQADSTFRLEGLPALTPVRAYLVPGEVCWGAGGAHEPAASPPRSLQAVGGYSAVADISAPGTPPLVIQSLEIVAPGGSWAAKFPVLGRTAHVTLRGWTATGESLAEDLILASPALRLESSNPSVATVSPLGYVTARGAGLAWIRASADGGWAQLLVLVDLAMDGDGDGMPDSFEVAQGLNPLDPADAARDADGDGLSNLEEFRRGTNPNKDDTDDDLLSDGVEVNQYGTDPLLADTDGDFTLDGSEVTSGTDPLNPNERPGSVFTPSLKQTRTLTNLGVRAAANVNDFVYIVTTDDNMVSYRVDTVNYFLIFNDIELLPGDLRDIAVEGNTAYVAAGSAGLHLVDVTNPAVLTLKGTVTGLGQVNGVVVRKGVVYVATDLIFWILTPQSGGGLNKTGSLAVPTFYRLAVSGPVAYLGIPGLNRLISVDISDPAAPRELQRLAMPASGSPFTAIEAAGRHVYVAHGSAGLLAISAVDPTHMAIVDSSVPDYAGAAFDALSLQGNRLAAHTPSAAAKAKLYRLRDDGLMDPVGDVDTNPAGTIQLASNQNYLVSLSAGTFSVSEILRSGDRGTTTPAGTLLLERVGDTVVPGDRIGIRARVRDDVYVESVEFYVDGKLVLRDRVPPFRLEQVVDPAAPTPYDIQFQAIASDLKRNEAPVGAIYVRVELDMDHDGIPDVLDPDRDGDGVPDIEEFYPGTDGFVSDPLVVDTDGDGIPDGEEFAPGIDGFVTNPSSPDTDGDGLMDPYEINVVATNPAAKDSNGDGVSDADEDPDGDGLANIVEARLGTNPRNSDTDGDGVPDGLETTLGLDPLKTDTDGNGISDGDEDLDGDGLSNKSEVLLGTNLAEPDTDFDGFDDLVERDLGTDPTTKTDFSGMDVVFTSRTVILRGPVTVGSLTLLSANLTVPPPNGGNVAPLDLSVVKTLSVDASSKIDASFKGYPGGKSAAPLGMGPPGLPAGGELTGGSHGGLGGHPASLSREDAQPVHGDPRRPADAGGGGSTSGTSGNRGGSGGGIVRIRADVIELNGVIAADGEGAPAVSVGGGAGGSVWIECQRIAGPGRISAAGGSVPKTGNPQPGAGGGGRIALHVSGSSTLNPAFIAAPGGGTIPAPELPAVTGGAGTVYLRIAAAELGELMVDNAGREQDEPATLLLGAGEGTIAELGDDFIVRGEGDFPVGIVGLEVDPDADDVEVWPFEILAVQGNRITTRPGLLAHTRPGARYQGLFRFQKLSVRSGGALETDALLVLQDGTEALRVSGGAAELLAPAVFLLSQQDLGLSDGWLSAGRLEGPGAVLRTLTLTRMGLQVGSRLAVGTFMLDSSIAEVGGPVDATRLDLKKSVLTVPGSAADRTSVLELDVEDVLSIDGSSRIDLDGKGYVGGGRGGSTSRVGQTADNVLLDLGGRTGGSHGGLGGIQGGDPGLGTAVAPVFDDFKSPRRPGGGGSGKLDGNDRGYNGGGLVRIVAREIVNEGRISADGDGVQRAGDAESGGAGAGGGIYLDAEVLRGAGEISADGGAAAGAVGSGCGGGGCIAIHHGDRTLYTGSAHAFGGVLIPATDRPASVGGAGTVFWKSRTQLYGDLVLDNANRGQSEARTPLRAVGSGTIQAIEASRLTAGVGTVFITSDTGLEGHWVILKDAVRQPFLILSNTESELSTDPASGDMTAVGALGDNFQGAFVLDNLTVIRKAAASTGGDLVIIATGAATISSDGTLSAPPIVKW